MHKQESSLSKSTYDTYQNDSDSKSDKSPKGCNYNINYNNNDESSRNKKSESKIDYNAKLIEKPFYYKKYTQAKTWKEYIKACIAIALLSLPFYGFFIFLTLFYFGSLYTRMILTLIAILQNFIPSSKNKYFDFVKSLEAVKYFRSFTIIVEEELPEKNAIFPSGPHGIMCWGTGLHLLHGLPIMKKFHGCGSRFLIYLPLTGIFGRLAGIEGVNNGNFKKLLQKGENVVFIPGGWESATLTYPNRDRLFIRNRKGFIKYSLMFGTKIFPIYNFGENKLFSTFKKWNFLDTLGLWLNKIKIPGVLFWGRLLFFPYADVDFCSVIGKGFNLPRIENPTNEDIEKYHKIYMEKVVELFDKYKKLYGASEKLEMY